MIWADVVRAAARFGVVPVAAALDMISLALLAVVAFVVGSASVVFDVGSFAYVPSLVQEADLAAANSAMQGSSPPPLRWRVPVWRACSCSSSARPARSPWTHSATWQACSA